MGVGKWGQAQTGTADAEKLFSELNPAVGLYLNLITPVFGITPQTVHSSFGITP